MRVVIAEDQFLLRDGLIRLLQAYEFEAAAAVDNGDDLLAELRASRPEAALVDVRLPPTFTDEGLRAALLARRELPGLPVLVLSQYGEQLYAHKLLADGATVMDPEVIARLLARRLVVTERATAKHTAAIFTQLDLQPTGDDNRRVLAVLAYPGGQ